MKRSEELSKEINRLRKEINSTVTQLTRQTKYVQKLEAELQDKVEAIFWKRVGKYDENLSFSCYRYNQPELKIRYRIPASYDDISVCIVVGRSNIKYSIEDDDISGIPAVHRQFVQKLLIEFLQGTGWATEVIEEIRCMYEERKKEGALLTKRIELQNHLTAMDTQHEEALIEEKIVKGNFYVESGGAPQAIQKVTAHTAIIEPLSDEGRRIHKSTIIGQVMYCHANILTKEELTVQLLEDKLA